MDRWRGRLVTALACSLPAITATAVRAFYSGPGARVAASWSSH